MTSFNVVHVSDPKSPAMQVSREGEVMAARPEVQPQRTKDKATTGVPSDGIRELMDNWKELKAGCRSSEKETVQTTLPLDNPETTVDELIQYSAASIMKSFARNNSYCPFNELKPTKEILLDIIQRSIKYANKVDAVDYVRTSDSLSALTAAQTLGYMIGKAKEGVESKDPLAARYWPHNLKQIAEEFSEGSPYKNDITYASESMLRIAQQMI